MASTTDAIISETYAIKEQLGDYPDVTTSLKRFGGSVKPVHHSVKVFRNKYNESKNVLIWGHPTRGIWGTDNWGTQEDAFSSELHAVIPANSTFVEYFHEGQYINPNSTGTIGVDLDGKEIYTMSKGDILISEVVFKNRQPITKAKITCGDLNTDLSYKELDLQSDLDLSVGGDFGIEISNDSGDTWVQLDSTLETTFDESSIDDELIYRIRANEDVVISNTITIT